MIWGKRKEEETYSAAEYCEGALTDVPNRARIDRFYARFAHSGPATVRTWDRRWRSFALAERIRGIEPEPARKAQSTMFLGD